MTVHMQQTGLFDNSDPQLKYKNVVLVSADGAVELVDWGVEEIFDIARFRKLRAVAYSATRSFVDKYLSGFDDVEIVIGAAETEMAKSVAAATSVGQIQSSLRDLYEWQADDDILHINPATSLGSLSRPLQTAVAEGRLRVRIPVGCLVHSKFYLLQGDDGRRLVLGSANLSEQAFGARRAQFEEIVVVETPELFEIYSDRYQNDIRPTTEPFYSENVIELVLRPSHKAKRGDADGAAGVAKANADALVVEINPEQVTLSIAQDTARELFEQKLAESVPRMLDKGVISDGVYESMMSLSVTVRGEDAYDGAKKDEYIARAIKESVTRDSRNGNATPAKPASRKKIAKKYINLTTTGTSAKTAEAAGIPPLLLMPDKRNVSNGETGLFVLDDLAGDFDASGPGAQERKLTPYGRLAGRDELRDALGKLDDFMQSYASFAMNYTSDYGKRLMEAVVFAFQAPFMREIRWRIADDMGNRANVPNFLILGATAGSGKTTLLGAISRLLWGGDATLSWTTALGGAQRQPGKNNALVRLLDEGCGQREGAFPVLVDEVEPNFFHKDTDAEKLIKDVANELAGKEDSKLACFICTTNATNSGGSTGVSLDMSARRRSYYLLIDRPIETKASGYRDATPITQLVEALDTTLSLDFDMRMAKALEDENTNWRRWDESTQRVDFLCVARDIFLEWYDECGVEVPAYFPFGLVEDFEAASRDKWNKLWRNHREWFNYDERKGTLLFDSDNLRNSSAFNNDVSVREYRQALPMEVCYEGARGASGKDLEILADKFCDWIGEKNPYKAKRWPLAWLRRRRR